MTVPEQELLKISAVAYVQPRVGGDEAEGTSVIQQRQAVKVEVDVQVALGIYLMRHGSGTALVAEEAGERPVHG